MSISNKSLEFVECMSTFVECASTRIVNEITMTRDLELKANKDSLDLQLEFEVPADCRCLVVCPLKNLLVFVASRGRTSRLLCAAVASDVMLEEEQIIATIEFVKNYDGMDADLSRRYPHMTHYKVTYDGVQHVIDQPPQVLDN